MSRSGMGARAAATNARLVQMLYRRTARSPRLLRIVLEHGTRSRAFTVVRYSEFRPLQRRPEVLALAALLESRGSSTMLEIGTANGGTALLLGASLSRPAVLTTVDIEPACHWARLRSAMPRRVTLNLEQADSHQSTTVDVARRNLPNGYDVVFIDGDHTYAGVRRDTEQFLSCARPGGLLVFHDIQPLGTDPAASAGLFVGGVPTWWQQLASLRDGQHLHAFVADATLPGFGIGVLELPSTQSGCCELAQRITDLERAE